MWILLRNLPWGEIVRLIRPAGLTCCLSTPGSSGVPSHNPLLVLFTQIIGDSFSLRLTFTLSVCRHRCICFHKEISPQRPFLSFISAPVSGGRGFSLIFLQSQWYFCSNESFSPQIADVLTKMKPSVLLTLVRSFSFSPSRGQPCLLVI